MHKCEWFLPALLRLSILFILSAPTQLYAWSAEGHSAIAMNAISRLPHALQRTYFDILAHGPWVRGQVKHRGYSTEALNKLISKAAVWPDRVKQKRLIELFNLYGSGSVPLALKAYLNADTRQWHYENTLYWSAEGGLVAAQKGRRGHCPPSFKGKLFQVWPLLFTAYKDTHDKRDKAIIVAYVLHLAADAYQPLHLFGSLNEQCHDDRGGNLYCVTPTVGFGAPSKECKQNLHKTWDQGFGFFSSADNLTNSKLKGRAKFLGDARDLSVVLTLAKPILDKIYPEKASDVLSPSYQASSMQVVERMSAYSTLHLVAALSLLEQI